MGCGSSKSKVGASAPIAVKPAPPSSAGPTGDKAKATKIEVKAMKSETMRVLPPLRKKSDLGSTGSLNSERGMDSARREVSATSRDSGYADAEYANVITEESDPTKVAEVERAFKERQNLDLSLVGVGRGGSAKLDRIDERSILNSLAADGLITRPIVSNKKSGYSFDVMLEEGNAEDTLLTPRSRPARLEKLEKLERRRIKKKPKREMTEEEIKAKLERAQERRKEKERQKLERIQAVTNASSDAVVTQETQKTEQTAQAQEELQGKMAAVTENRERRNNALREKMRAAKEHAEEVRRRKKLQQLQEPQQPGGVDGSEDFEQQTTSSKHAAGDDQSQSQKSNSKRPIISEDPEFEVPEMDNNNSAQYFNDDNDDDYHNYTGSSSKKVVAADSDFFDDQYAAGNQSKTRSKRGLALDLPEASD